MSIREEAHDLLDRLSERDLETVTRMLRGLVPPAEESRPAVPETQEQRRARSYALAGKYAHTHTSVDDFLARKHADKVREDEADRRRQAGEG